MQEAKRFSTALFGFDRKAVLDYIYEQDKQAREALEELAVRNDTLDRKAAELNEFADRGDVSGYAREAMAWAVAEGLLTGMGGSCLAPTAPATRAQVAEILSRFLRAVECLTI